MKLLPVCIKTGNFDISGLLYIPEVQANDISILLTHGYTAGKYSLDHLASVLTRKGYECLIYDLPGHLLGGTGGELWSYEDALQCTLQCANWLEKKRSGRIVFGGHSLGAALSIHAAIEYEVKAKSNLVGLVAMSIGEEPYLGFESRLGQSMIQLRESHVSGLSAVQFLKDLDKHIKLTDSMMKTESLFLAGDQDFVAPPKRVEALAQRICTNSSFMELKANHLEMPQKAANTILNWLQVLH